MGAQADTARGARWLDELFGLSQADPEDVAKAERYLGALSMVESLGLRWQREEDGTHRITGQEEGMEGPSC